MTPAFRLALLSSTALVLLGSATTFLVSLGYPRVRARLARLPPDVRARLVLAWTALPWLVSACLLVLCFIPSLLSLLGLAADHCPAHDDGHLHVCFAHARAYPVSTVEWALVTIGALAVGGVAARLFLAQIRTWRVVESLLRVAGDEVRAGGLVASTEPLAVTAGLVRPLVLVSTGLRSRLSGRHLDAVLAHERAHARRRDPLLLLTVAMLGAAHLPRTRALLMADAAAACEKAADEEAAREVGDRVLVAEAIVAVERALREPVRKPFGLAVGMAGCAAAARVEAMLADPIPAAPTVRSLRYLAWPVLAVGALLVSYEIHHLTETVLDLIAR